MENYSEIKAVTLNIPDRKDPLKAAAIDFFEVITKNDVSLIVPTTSDNRHYWMIREWYLEQKKKPFKFSFEDTPEAKLEPESDEDGSGHVVASIQTEDAELPDINLTDDQIVEINAERNSSK